MDDPKYFSGTTPWMIQGVVVDGKVMGSVFKEDKYAGRETKVVNNNFRRKQVGWTTIYKTKTYFIDRWCR